MATLNSPGVSVSVIDQSFYTPTAPGTIPLVVVASQKNKQAADGSGIAQGTLDTNAGKVYVITSQRDLTATFGTPYFEKDASGNPINASELNEYGLQAAYSALGVTSNVYVVRADVDLGQLSPQATAPVGKPMAGTYWLDTATTSFGINVWNADTQTFSVVTPLIIDNTNMDTDASGTGPYGPTPAAGFGQNGNFAVYVTSENNIQLWYKNSVPDQSGSYWIPVIQDFAAGRQLTISPHYQYPNYTNSTPTGSVWVKTTTPGKGANYQVKYYNGSTQTWNNLTAHISTSTQSALYSLDQFGGGTSIPVGSVFVESNFNHGTGTNVVSDFKLWRRAASTPTAVSFTANSGNISSQGSFYIRETLSNSNSWSSVITVNVPASNNSAASTIPAALSAAGLINVTAVYNAGTGQLTFKHALGGDFELADGTSSPLGVAVGVEGDFTALTPFDPATGTGVPFLNTPPSNDYADNAGTVPFTWLVSNWEPLVFEATSIEPTSKPADGTLWYDSSFDADIMYNNGSHWVGYRTAFPSTDINGPQVAYTAPTTQSTGASLADGDIWISTADLDNYVNNIYVYNATDKTWVLQDTTDHTSPNGWLFADARWSGAGSDIVPDTIQNLLTYDYLDPDAPSPLIYPRGTRLFNTRRSGFNVKQYKQNYIDIYANGGLNLAYNNDVMDGEVPYFADRWVTASPVNALEQGTFGRLAQRAVVVEALKASIDTNTAIRDTDTLVYNLIACPGYPEVISNMVGLNTDRGQTAFVIGDTPFRLPATGTALLNWGNNTAGATDNGDAGAVTFDQYSGLFYPSGLTNDNTGHNVVVPPSHMMLRTIINSDNRSYQWFAPAGTRRGVVDNATSVGYVDTTGKFITTSLHQGLRDVMAGVQINPIATIPGIGLVNYGQYTHTRVSSALDRINVVRLIAYLRGQLNALAKPFLFEPNDTQTRSEIKAAADSLLLELVGLRAIYDFITVCDSSNNTPARIDKNELWLDIAIEPVKSVEFIYIPLRILNTGSIESGNYGNTTSN